MLSGVATRVADVQELVKRYVGPETLLVGHTLENDLKALRMVHPCCVDTALLFPNPKVRQSPRVTFCFSACELP